MTQRSCCVPGCSVKFGDGVLLHRFPNPNNPDKIEQFRTWIMKIGGDIIGEDNNYIYRNRKVCHRHFEEVYTFPNMRLSALAIPTLHIPGAHVGQCKKLASCTSRTLNPIEELQIPSTSFHLTPEISHTQGAHVGQCKKLASCTSRTLNPIEELQIPSTSFHLTPEISHTQGRRMNPPQYLTSTEKQLKSIISEMKLKLRKCKNINKKLKLQNDMGAKLLRSAPYNALKEKMTSAAQTFFKMQISQFLKKPTGRRFTVDEKILCLSLYKPCPKAYRILSQMCILPKRKTLEKLLSRINLQPGINEIIFLHLKKRVEKMPERFRYCSLIFDEMAISPNLLYDKKHDTIHGFLDDGEQRLKVFADHVCVFMIRGVSKKYKQPVAFTFCKGSTKSADLTNFLGIIIKKINECGLKVVATVCDQGTSNVAALNILMNRTKEWYIKEEKNYSGGFFEINNNKIYVIYDPPHLMKGVRNNLLTKNLEFTEDGKLKLASWSHVEALYRRGPGYRGVKLVNKLTAQHVVPSMIPKMKVKNCTQVFSENVGRTMGYMAEIGRLPKQSMDTADLLLFFDRVFDSINGNYHKPQGGKIYRSAVTLRSPHHRLWYKSLPILKSMKFVSKSGKKGTVPSLTSWVKTIEAFIALTKDLNNAGIKSLLLRNINQDPIENFFGAIRSHGLRNIMPSAYAFINAYKSLLICNISSHNSVGANCEEDNTDLLQSLKCLLSVEDLPQRNSSVEIDINHLNISEANVDELINNNEKKEKCAAVAYCSGWLINIIKKRIYKDCENCKNDIESSQIHDFHAFIKIKEYQSSKTFLAYPTRNVFSYFYFVENIVYYILQTHCNIHNIREYIDLIVSMHINYNFLHCALHRKEIVKVLHRKTIIFCINNWCKELNQLLTGKTTFWDETDEMKVAARNYYLTHSKKGAKNK